VQRGVAPCGPCAWPRCQSARLSLLPQTARAHRRDTREPCPKACHHAGRAGGHFELALLERRGQALWLIVLAQLREQALQRTAVPQLLQVHRLQLRPATAGG